MIQSGASPSDLSHAQYLKKEWGNSISKFSSEVNKRIRFNHRGLLALAIPLETIGQSVKDDEMLFGQFFITLDETPWLDGKNVIIGTVNGPTIFNAIRIGRTEVADEETGEPVDPDTAPAIKSVTVIDHPLETLHPNKNVPWNIVKGVNESMKKKKKRKGKRDLNVLSFGNDEEHEMDQNDYASEKSKGMKSSHDVVADQSSFLMSASMDPPQQNSNDNVSIESNHHNAKLTHCSENTAQTENVTNRNTTKSKENIFEKQIDRSNENMPLDMKRKENDSSDNNVNNDDKSTRIKKHIESHEASRKDLLARHGKGVKNASVGSKALEDMQRHSDNGLMSEVQTLRAKYLKRKKNHGNRDDDTFAKLLAFQSKVHKIKVDAKANSHSQEDEVNETYRGQVLENASDDESPTNDWLLTNFKCKKHIDHESRLGKVTGGDGRSADDYVVIDENRPRWDDSHSRHR